MFFSVQFVCSSLETFKDHPHQKSRISKLWLSYMDYMCMFWNSSYMQSAVVIGITLLTVNERFEGYTSSYLQVFQGKRLSHCATRVPWKWEEVDWQILLGLC